MGIFSGVENAKNNKSGNHFPPNAQGVVTLTGVKIITSAQKGVTFMVIEGKVTACSTHPDLVGSERSSLIDMSKPSALSNVKNFVAAALAMPFDEVTERDCEGVVERTVDGKVPPSPLVGMPIAFETVVVKTRKGTDFTKINWSEVA